jgi:hypothetical protein
MECTIIVYIVAKAVLLPTLVYKMKEFFRKILSTPKADAARQTRWYRPAGQSLVEVAITLPFLFILFLGMVEFGFMLNHYVALTDATRESARFFSNGDPFNPDGSDYIEFYNFTASTVKSKLEPDLNLESGVQSSRRILLDPVVDDIVVSVFSVCNGNVVARYPAADGFHWTGNHTSRFTDSDDGTGRVNIESRLVAAAPATGLLLVEVYYDYHLILPVPFITSSLAPQITLYSYTIMPLSAAEPASCP